MLGLKVSLISAKGINLMLELGMLLLGFLGSFHEFFGFLLFLSESVFEVLDSRGHRIAFFSLHERLSCYVSDGALSVVTFSDDFIQLIFDVSYLLCLQLEPEIILSESLILLTDVSVLFVEFSDVVLGLFENLLAGRKVAL